MQHIDGYSFTLGCMSATILTNVIWWIGSNIIERIDKNKKK